TDQGDRRERDLFARLAVQAARAAHLFQFGLQPDDAVGDHPPVQLDLGFAGTADAARAAALALQVGPGADKARAFVFQPGQLDLEATFTRAGATAEDLEDQSGSVDDLDVPEPFQVALLHR